MICQHVIDFSGRRVGDVFFALCGWKKGNSQQFHFSMFSEMSGGHSRFLPQQKKSNCALQLQTNASKWAQLWRPPLKHRLDSPLFSQKSLKASWRRGRSVDRRRCRLTAPSKVTTTTLIHAAPCKGLPLFYHCRSPYKVNTCQVGTITTHVQPLALFTFYVSHFEKVC